MSREAHLVELVDDGGTTVGSATVEQAHQAPGLLHRAFSVLLFDSEGRTLLQRRAATKTRFPLRWANACCGHPSPGVGVVESATQRLSEELGLTGVLLTQAGIYAYAAADPATGRVEREYDHVLVGRLTDTVEVSPDPAEVAELRWARARSLAAPAEPLDDNDYAPWLAGVLAVALDAVPSTITGIRRRR